MNTPEETKDLSRLFAGGGEMGKVINDFPWKDTALGEIRNWPQSLVSAAGICLNSNFPIAIYWGRELNLIYNDAWSPIPGLKHPWALGRTAKEVWPEIWEDIQPSFEITLNTGKATGSKDALLPMNRHGYVEECYFDFTFTPIYGESGGVAGIFNAVIETTYRVINERRAKFISLLSGEINAAPTNEELFQILERSLQEAGPDVPFCCYYSHGSSGWKKEISVHLDEAEAAKLLALVQEPAQYKHFDNIDQVIGRPIANHWPERIKEVVYLPVMINGTTAGGFLFGISSRLKPDEEYLKFFQSIVNLFSGELQARAALIEQKRKADELEALDRAKTVFFSNISHEFRTPLTLMLGPLEEEINVLKNNLPERTRQNIETAHRNGMRLLKLVNGLLDFSRIEAGRQKANFTLVDIVSFTKNLAANFQAVIEKGGLQFIIKADSFIQPVYIDRDMWEKVVFNLLSNAFKFTLKGSITVSMSSDEENALLKISDTGVGIPESELPNLFQRFHRIENTGGRTFEGTGIGLSMIKELVKLLGGSIGVSSELGKGTTFTVKIPFGKNHIPKEQIKDNSEENEYLVSGAFIGEATSLLEKMDAKPGDNSGSGQSGYILIVDDNSDMREHLKSLLQEHFPVKTAANGLDALHRIKESAPALIISDVMMPILNGIELLRELKLHPATSQIPVIILTARAGEESKIEGYETGADDYLVKPFSSKELLARIRMQLKMNEAKKNADQHIYDIFAQAPVAITIFKGRELVCEFANDSYLEIVKKSRAEFIGKPLFESLPETKELLFPLAMHLLDTGEPFPANEFEITLHRNGRDELCYFNSIWTPLRDNEKRITGIICCVHEVTQQIMNRKQSGSA
jgi:signal transduction histidine kinase/CheY-like chemotaxis protein